MLLQNKPEVGNDAADSENYLLHQIGEPAGNISAVVLKSIPYPACIQGLKLHPIISDAYMTTSTS